MQKTELIIDLREKSPIRKQKKSKAKKGFIRSGFEWLIYMIIFVGLVWGTPAGLKKMLDSEYPIASITSSSMWPELKKGDIVFIEGVEGKEDVSEGDIVVFENRRGFTIHRIVKLKEDKLITRGDANNVDDPPVKYEQLVGRALEWRGKTLTIPQLGKLSHTVQAVKDKIIKTVNADAN